MGQPFTLFRLQQIETKLDSLSSRLKEIDDVLSADRELKITEKNLSDAEKQHANQAKELKVHEHNLDNQRIKIEQSEAALYGGKIRNPKELQDLENEIVSLKKYLVVLEDRLLESMLSLENAEIKLTTRKKEYFQILEKNQQRKGELEKEKTSIKTEYDRLTSESQVHRDTLSPEDTSLYDTLREKRRGIAVATVVDGTCSACGSTLSASLLQSAKMMNQITLCNSCGRILYWGA